MPVSRRFVIIAVAALAFACGRKGPPLAPLHLVPTAPANISVARVGSDAQLRFDVPGTNQNGPGTVAIDRIEVFAATVAAGAIRPPNRELLTPKYRIATIAIKPPPVEGEAPPEESASDTRPSPGQRTTFVETLTEKAMEPVFTTPAPKPAAPAGATATATPSPASAASSNTAAPPGSIPPVPELPPAIEAVPALPDAAGALAPVPSLPQPAELTVAALPGEPTSAPGAPAYPARLYTVRGVTKSGRPGPPSTRVELPLVDPPAQPPAPQAVATETAIVLTWPTPAPTSGAIAYNVYKGDAPDPINGAPVAEGKYERGGVTFGTEECFRLRAVQKLGAVTLESGPSAPVCLTPRDTFAPAAPKGLSIVAGTGTMNLGWDANTEADLAGYLVLRGEAPGDTLQPLTPAPIAATSYEDKSVKPGVRYVYSIVAIDKASPPNRSAPSARVEETAR